MKLKLICATIVLLAIIGAVVAGCVVSESALPLIVLPFCNLNLPECPVPTPVNFIFHPCCCRPKESENGTSIQEPKEKDVAEKYPEEGTAESN